MGIEITRKDHGSVAAPSEYFIGSAHMSSRFQRPDPARLAGVVVSFDPGGRTNWHTHPLGQTLIITEGVGWVQQEGDQRLEMRIGDIIWIPPGVRHWHGATAASSMTHVAVQEALDGKSVVWMEPVSDEDYEAR